MKIIDKINNKIFNILIGNTTDNIIFICDYINKFISLKEEKYIGIDFEFKTVSKDKKEIALMQINLETSLSNKGNIFILDLILLNNQQIKIIKNLLCNKHIIKILHGSEALDIPYLINNLLDNSAPCSGCSDMIRQLSFKNVYYSNIKGNFDKFLVLS